MKSSKNLREFKGKNVYCPCCGNNFSTFLKFTVDIQYNKKMFENTSLDVVCPYCQSLPRHRIICDCLEKNKWFSFSNVLLFAPARSLQLWLKRNKIHYISADLFDRTVDMKVDIQKIPFEDNTFDFISCDHVLEHVPDYALALRELFRVVKTGGHVEITVPLLPDMSTTYEDNTLISPADRINAFGQNDHLRVFGVDFSKKLQETGFDVTMYDGDTCDKRIMPLTAPAIYDYNKIFICKKCESL